MSSLETIVTKLFFIFAALDIFMGLTQRSYTQIQKQPLQQEQIQEEPIVQEEAGDDFQFKNDIPQFIDIFYCNRSGLHKTYEELKKKIHITYPRHRIEIQGHEFPIPQQNQVISQIVSYAQWALFAFGMFYKNILDYLKVPIPAIINKIAEKKMMVFMFAYFLIQQLQNSLLTTQGFRVVVDNQVTYEGTGSSINMEAIIQSLQDYIQ